MKYAIVLAAGKGTRMRSSKNKVMHTLLHKPMIGHVVDHLDEIDIEKTVVVTGYESESVQSYLQDRVEYAMQDEQNGTAHAVAQVDQLRGKIGSTIVLYGDCALIQSSSMEAIFQQHEGYDLTILTANVTNPDRYARVIRDRQGDVMKIVDARDVSELDTAFNEINLGVYCFNNELLFKYLADINHDSKDELNIVDLVEILKEKGHRIQAIRVKDAQEFMGVNDRYELMLSTKWLRDKINMHHLSNGVTIYDPETTYIGKDVIIEEDVTIYPNTHIYGDTHIKSGATITSNSWLNNVVVGEQTTIESSKIVDSIIGSYTTIGPYAHIRVHSVVGDHVRIGDYVELKKTTMGNHASSAHLSYLGDATIAERVNIGGGVITVNYDGKLKHPTTIDEGAFIGCNVNLIAPIRVGKDAVIAAGSTLDKDVEDGSLAIARSRQENKLGYGEKFLKNKREKI